LWRANRRVPLWAHPLSPISPSAPPAPGSASPTVAEVANIGCCRGAARKRPPFISIASIAPHMAEVDQISGGSPALLFNDGGRACGRQRSACLFVRSWSVVLTACRTSPAMIFECVHAGFLDGLPGGYPGLRRGGNRFCQVRISPSPRRGSGANPIGRCSDNSRCNSAEIAFELLARMVCSTRSWPCDGPGRRAVMIMPPACISRIAAGVLANACTDARRAVRLPALEMCPHFRAVGHHPASVVGLHALQSRWH